MTIPITYLRSSSYGAHDFCPMRYFGEYTLGWNGPSNMKADKGTIVHKVLEILACSKKAQQDGLKSFTDDICGEITSDVMSIEIDPLTEQVYDYYSKAFKHHDWQPKDLREVKRWVHKVFEQANGAFDPRKRDIVEPEQRFDFEIQDDWAKYEYEIDGQTISGRLALKGTIDLITKVGDGFYEIIDWKTGKRINWGTGEEKTQEYLFHDPQLRLYHYAAHCLYPNVEQIMITINFMNDGGAFTIFFQRKDIPDTIEMLKKKFEEIKNTEVPQLNTGWKCRKFCYFGTTTFEGTHVLPIIQKGRGHVTNKGQTMCKCEQLDFVLKHRPLDTVVKHMSAPGHVLGHYKAPGST
jgi:hypothetical protein